MVAPATVEGRLAMGYHAASSRILVAVVVLFVANSVPARAQQILDRPTLYRLEAASRFLRGCFDPCDCLAPEPMPVGGTFRLELVSIGDVYDFYEVRGVRWRVPGNEQSVRITGFGTYKVSTIADLQQMSLQLLVGDEPQTLYWSDEVPGGTGFPRIDVPISIHGAYCYDTVIEVRARPAPRLRVDREELSWDPDWNATRYDAVWGDLGVLRASGGAYDVALLGCLGDDIASTSVAFWTVPEEGEGFWFLHRGEGGGYDDEDAGQVGSADALIAASPPACP